MIPAAVSAGIVTIIILLTRWVNKKKAEPFDETKIYDDDEFSID